MVDLITMLIITVCASITECVYMYMTKIPVENITLVKIMNTIYVLCIISSIWEESVFRGTLTLFTSSCLVNVILFSSIHLLNCRITTYKKLVIYLQVPFTATLGYYLFNLNDIPTAILHHIIINLTSISVKCMYNYSRIPHIPSKIWVRKRSHSVDCTDDDVLILPRLRSPNFDKFNSSMGD